jgi:hypothetical protein
MLDRSRLGADGNGGQPPEQALTPASEPDEDAAKPDQRLMAMDLPDWDLEPPAVLIRRPSR